MNYRQIEIFAAIMERSSITEAAQMLGLSQPAVSKSLKLLEEELGLSLFRRTTRGLQATDEARELYSETSRILQGFASLSTLAKNLNRLEHARLSISAMPALCSIWLPRVAASFSVRFPDIKLDLRARGSAEIVKLAAQGDLDIGIGQVMADNSSVVKQRLGDLHGVCVLPQTHPLVEKEAISSDDLHQEMLVTLSETDEFRRRLDAQMLTSGLDYKSNISVSSSTMVCGMVEAGCGIGIVDSETAQIPRWQSVVFRPIRPTIRIPTYIIRSVHRPQSLAMRLFIEHILQMQPKSPF